MNLKIIFGIVLPIAVIVALAMMSLAGEKEIQKITFTEKLVTSDIFDTDGNFKGKLSIGKIELLNNQFLPKKIIVPKRYACLIDTDFEKNEIYLGEIIYTNLEIESNNNRNDIIEEIAEELFYDGNRQVYSIELGLGESKNISMYLDPVKSTIYEEYSRLVSQYDYNKNNPSRYNSDLVKPASSPYEYMTLTYLGYNEIWIVEAEQPDNNYNSRYYNGECNRISNLENKNIGRIKIAI